MPFLNYDFDCVFSHILTEWNNISDLTPFLQKKKQGRISKGGGRLVKHQCTYNARFPMSQLD
jgi:hypothetical protein